MTVARGERPLRTAEVIAVGSELLGTARIDTNSLFVTQELSAIGIEVRAKAVAGDDQALLVELCRAALQRADVVVLTGGLGPTEDDLTREAVAAATGRSLVEQPHVVERLAARFAARGMAMPAINRRQAQLLTGGVLLDNPHGTAPGQYLEHDGRAIVLLPGPPRELRPMLQRLAAEVLARRSGGSRLHRLSMFITGRGESHVDDPLRPLYDEWRAAEPPIEVTILATPGQVELHLSIRTDDPRLAEDRLARARAAVEAIFGRDLFSVDGRNMEQIVGELLREGNLTIAAAESCTGGLMLSRLTDVPGSSAYVLGGGVLYANSLKTAFAQVSEDLIRAHGAVSEQVAVAMAEGIRTVSGADVGVGITGIAGPGGGTQEKPVGTVAIAVLAPESSARVRTFRFPGDRALIKFNASQAALDMVRRALAG